jgi:uncharacterized C2H2 Zn-finger protein
VSRCGLQGEDDGKAPPSPVRALGNGTAQWQCPVCDRKFTKRSNAKRHAETVHDRSRFWRCKLCRRTFTQRGSLTRHLQRAHGMTRGSRGLAAYVQAPPGVSIEVDPSDAIDEVDDEGDGEEGEAKRAAQRQQRKASAKPRARPAKGSTTPVTNTSFPLPLGTTSIPTSLGSALPLTLPANLGSAQFSLPGAPAVSDASSLQAAFLPLLSGKTDLAAVANHLAGFTNITLNPTSAGNSAKPTSSSTATSSWVGHPSLSPLTLSSAMSPTITLGSLPPVSTGSVTPSTLANLVNLAANPTLMNLNTALAASSSASSNILNISAPALSAPAISAKPVDVPAPATEARVATSTSP